MQARRVCGIGRRNRHKNAVRELISSCKNGCSMQWRWDSANRPGSHLDLEVHTSCDNVLVAWARHHAGDLALVRSKALHKSTRSALLHRLVSIQVSQLKQVTV